MKITQVSQNPKDSSATNATIIRIMINQIKCKPLPMLERQVKSRSATIVTIARNLTKRITYQRKVMNLAKKLKMEIVRKTKAKVSETNRKKVLPMTK